MKALLSTATGGPETLVLGELPRPTAGAGQIVIDVKACAVNFPDTCPKAMTSPRARRC